MLQLLIATILVVIPLWAPWMDSTPDTEIAARVLSSFGSIPSVCYDGDKQELQEGLQIKWYPLGRLVHTCSGDYIVWFWGAVKKSGGVYKKSNELADAQSRPLSCQEVLVRQNARMATSTGEIISPVAAPWARELDYSIFPLAKEQNYLLRETLKNGPNFAGKFAVAEWECGTTCQNHAVIDVTNGKVIGLGPQTEYGVQFSLDSTMLVTNPKSNLPELPNSSYEAEGIALNIARLPREYLRLTKDARTGSEYLVRECVESSVTGYVEVEDERLGVNKYNVEQQK